MEVKVGEAMGLLLAMQWTMELGLNNVKFEVDSR